MSTVYLNHIATAVPAHNMHRKFIEYVPQLVNDNRVVQLFNRMAARSQINNRYSVLTPHPEPHKFDDQGFYQLGDFPTTGQRMGLYQRHAFSLAKQAIDKLLADSNTSSQAITHLIITSCTGFYAPGLDCDIVAHYQLNPSVERTLIGFMGCNAAINGLKTAAHVVKSSPDANVLMVNLELSTLHFKETQNLESLLAYLLFADGCAASLISAKPSGLKLNAFYATVLADSASQITWTIGDSGFDMVLSGQVPKTIAKQLPTQLNNILSTQLVETITHWAIHPGGRSVLDAVETAINLAPEALAVSRQVLSDYGNMSSATVMFVLKVMLDSGRPGKGCAMAFGPGITLESMLFNKV